MSQIYNGSFVLGDTSATTLSAGEGIKLDTSVPGVIGISNDETVLWDGNGTAATEVNLSEAITNFERIRFYIDTAETIGVYIVEEKTKGTYFEFSINRINDANAWIVMSWSIYDITNNNKKLTGRNLKHMWFSAGNFSRGGTGTNGPRLLKVVGINRISGGN